MSGSSAEIRDLAWSALAACPPARDADTSACADTPTCSIGYGSGVKFGVGTCGQGDAESSVLGVQVDSPCCLDLLDLLDLAL